MDDQTEEGMTMIALRNPVLATAAYVSVTFPLAAIWHAGLFASTYQAFGYFEGEPSFGLGLLAIFIQGAAASYLYAYVSLSGRAVVRGLKYALLIGLFFWTSHVLAFVAKRSIDEAGAFVAMETAYLTIQFGVYGVLLGLIFRERR